MVEDGKGSGSSPQNPAMGTSRSAAFGAPDDSPEFTPHIPASESIAEFTLKSLVAGVIFGILFGAANAYLGLRAGLTISTSIPVAVMTVAVFRALHGIGVRSSILESNMSQTVGSASSSVASGIIFTLPALFLWGLDPTLITMTLLGLCGGLLGILFMIPLRKLLIVREHGKLPYPEGTACAEVLRASEVGGSRAKNVFVGLGVGAAVKFLTGWSRVIPGSGELAIPFLPKGRIGLDFSAALFGVGYILGPRVATIMVGGGLLSALVIIPAIAIWGQGRPDPLYPETVALIPDMTPGQIWTRYVRYIGAGAVATGGLITLIRSIPVMVRSFQIGAREVRARLGTHSMENVEVPRTQQDLPSRTVFLGAGLIVLAITLVPQIFVHIGNAPGRLVAALLVAIFAFFFVTVSSRIVGLVGVTSNPTSGMTIAALLGTSTVFLALGWTDAAGKAAALSVGCVVAIAASIAGDTSQDLKTGFLLGATPRRQQTGELIGVLTSAVFVCLAVLLLDRGYGFGSTELPAPQATLMKVVIEGVLDQSLPWVLVGIGVAIALVVEAFRIPSLPFAVGVYLPVATMVPVFIGGMVRRWMERRAATEEEADARREKGILLGSGLVGGEGLLGVGIAAMAAYSAAKGTDPWEIGHAWLGGLAPLAGLAVFVALVVWFANRCRRNSPEA